MRPSPGRSRSSSAVAVIYLADDDFEVNEERLEAIAPPLGDDDRAWLADCLADDDDDEPTDSDAQAIDEAAELVASTTRCPRDGEQQVTKTTTTGGSDPYAIEHLACGHEVIAFGPALGDIQIIN